MTDELIPLEFIATPIPDYARPTIELIRAALEEEGFTASDRDINQAHRSFCERYFCMGWLDIPTIENARNNIGFIRQYLGRVG